jgi:hypothetical protein
VSTDGGRGVGLPVTVGMTAVAFGSEAAGETGAPAALVGRVDPGVTFGMNAVGALPSDDVGTTGGGEALAGVGVLGGMAAPGALPGAAGARPGSAPGAAGRIGPGGDGLGAAASGGPDSARGAA